MRWMWRTSVAALAVSAGACANLETKKVPVGDRACGQDYKHHGFRYYLSRPYVAVAQRVDVAYNYNIGEVVPVMEMKPQNKPGGVGVGIRSLFPDPHTKQYALFDLEGRSLPQPTTEKGGWVAVSKNTGVVPASFQMDGLNVKQQQEVDEKIKAATSVLSGQQQTQVAQLIEKQIGKTGTGGLSIPQTIELTLINKTASAPGTPPDAFQVVFLPDFEQQMAIKDCNFLGYSKYELSFADGWQLGGVKGTFDSTEVPVRILQSISNAINAAASIQKKGLTTLPISPQEIASAALNRSKDAGKNAVALVLLTRTEYIAPGMYRLQKPSEMNCDEKAGVGFLTELGIPTQTDYKVQLIDTTK